MMETTTVIAPGEVGSARRVFRALLGFVPLIAVVVVVCWTEDPSFVFGRASVRPDQQVAQAWLSKQNAIVEGVNFDERLAMRDYFEALPPSDALDVVAFGSSRTMALSGAEFPESRFFNASVSGGALEDYIAIHGIMLAHGVRPRQVIFGVDPWIFNRRNGQQRWRSVTLEYEQERDRLLGRRSSHVDPSRTFDRLAQLVSPAYFQASVISLLRSLTNGSSSTGKNTVEITSERVVSGAIRYADGSGADPLRIRNLSADVVRERAVTEATGTAPYSLTQFERIDPDLRHLFELYLGDLHNEGISVIIFLPAYQPEAYQRLVSNPSYRVITDVETYVRTAASARGIPVRGSYNPTSCGLTDADFSDMMHLRRESIPRAYHCVVADGQRASSPVRSR